MVQGGERRFGRYELLRPLGSGGMAEVWAAVLHGPGGFRKPVALKLLHERGSEHEREGLIREARIGAMLSHPHLVAVHELGSVDGRLFVAMEEVVGTTVAELLRPGPLPPAVVLDIGVQTCLGLAHLHAATVDGRPAGVVHRDIKPQNLLVDRNGVVKIADLGVARWLGEGGRGGTAGYMAPEQWEGGEDGRADLFSLGVTLLALVTRQRPLGSGRTARAAALAIEERLADPAFLAPAERAVPGLGAVLSRCLRRDPGRRYASAAELLRALRDLRPPPDPISLVDLVARARPELGPAPDTSRSPVDEPTRLLGRGNAGRPLEPLVGRADELEQLRALVDGDARLVTLAGPGGAGKTRLAREIAWTAGRALEGGAWFCDLADAVDGEGVCRALAAALSVPVPRGDAVEQLGRALQARGRAIVVLDNLEQVVGPAAPLLARWREAAPEATLLVTTQVPTRLPDERVVHLGPMLEADAVELFRRRSARPLEPDELPLIGVLVRALDAQPLAVELAAGRTRVLGVAGIVQRLDDRLRLLSGGEAWRPERHRSLRASLDASVELLPAFAADALAQLAVFRGPVPLEAAEAVIELSGHADAPWTLDVLHLLVERSLLGFDAAGQRFRMLATVRAYAAGLGPEALRQGARARHAAHFAARVDPRALDALQRADGPGPFAALVEAREDLEAAFRFAVEAGDGATALATFRGCWEVLQQLGPYARARELLADLERMPLDARDELARSFLCGVVRHATGDGDGGLSAFERYRDLARAAGDRAAEGRATGYVALALGTAGRPEEADAAFGAALVLLDEGRADPRTRAILLGNHASHLHDRDEHEAALAHHEEALRIHRAHGERWHEARIRVNAANVLRALGRLAEARDHLERALALHRRLGKRRSEATALSSLASLLRLAGEPDEALRCFEAALAACRELGHVRGEATALGNLANLHASQGRLAEARPRLLRAAALHREVGEPLPAVGVELNLARLETLQGRWASARALLERALAEHGARLGRRRVGVLVQLAELDRLEGAWEAASHRLGEAAALAGDGPEAAEVLAGAVELHLATGDGAAARRELARLPGPSGDPRKVAALQVLRARVLLASGDAAGALEAVDLALTAHDRTKDPRERAVASVVRAEALLAVGAGALALRTLASAEPPLRAAEDVIGLVGWHVVRGAAEVARGGDPRPWVAAARDLCDQHRIPERSPLRARG